MDLLRPVLRAAFGSLILAASLGMTACSQDTPESHLASGKEYAAKNEHAAAVIEFKSALQGSKVPVEVRFHLGRSLLQSGDPLAAAVELVKAQELGWPQDQVVPVLAQAWVVAGNYKRLVSALDSAQLADSASQAALKTSLSVAWAALNQRVRAEKALEAALSAAPDHAPALVMRARLIASQGDVKAAQALVDKVLSRDARSVEGWHLAGELKLVGGGDTQPGAEALRKALEIDKTHVQSHSALIGLALRAKDAAAAKAQLAQMTAAAPNHPQTAYMVAQVALSEGDLKRARELTQVLLRGASDHTGVLLLAGVVEAQLGSMVVAESYFNKALALDPELVFARRSLAQAYARLGQPEKALETLRPLVGPEAKDVAALTLASEIALNLGDARQSETYLTRAAKLDPKDTRVNAALALTHIAKGDAQRTFAELSRLSEQSAADITADLSIVSARFRRAEWDAALQALDAMALKAPKNANVHELRGRAHLARKDLPAARKAFEDALALDPSLFSAIRNLSAVDILEKKPEAALARLRKVVADDPRNHFAAVALAQLMGRMGLPLPDQRAVLQAAVNASPQESAPRLELVELNIKHRRYTEALSVAQEAVAALPGQRVALDALGRAQTLTGDAQQAIGTFRRLGNLDPKSALAHTRLADLYTRIGDRKNAELSWRRALEVDPDSDIVQSRLIVLLLNDRRTADAIAVARELQKARPASASGHLFEGAVHLRQRNYDAALVAFRSGLSREPERSELGVRIHQSLSAAGRMAEADRFAEDWLLRNPGDAGFAYRVAVARMGQGSWSEAEQILRTIVEQHPNHPLALNNLAWLIQHQGKPGALVFAERANAAAPDQPAIMDTLAMALAADKQLTAALELQKKAIAIAPDELNLRLNLARIAIQAGDVTLARKELEALAKRGGQFPAHEEVRKLLRTL